MTANVSLNANLEWLISLIDDFANTLHQFPKYLLPNCQNPRVCSVDDTMRLLKCCDDSCLCTGNPDAKFEEIRDLRKGKFMDQQSMSIMLQYINIYAI